MSIEKAKAKQIQVDANASTPEGSLQELIETRKILPTATITLDGAMSKEDKAKLEDLPSNSELTTTLSGKVDNVSGKGLSTNDYSNADKAKLASLESSHFRGVYVNEAALAAISDPIAGDYADVDAGTGSDAERWIYDASDTKWVAQASATSVTASQVKQLYESNADTNAFTDTEKTKLSALPTNQTLTTQLGTKADKTTQVIAGTGLTGGGTLAADRTLSVNYGTTEGTAAQGNDSRLSNSREWTAGTISQAEAEAGTATTRRAFTAQRVRQAIVAWFNGISGALGRTILSRTTAAEVRSDIGLGTAATKNVGTAAGNVMEVGAFGLGITSTPNTVADDKDIRELASGIYSLNKTHFQSVATDGAVLWVGMRVGTNSTFILHQASSNKMWISTKYSNPTGEISWVEIHHAGNIQQTTGNSTEYPMSQNAVTTQLATKAPSSHTHTWSQVTGKPTTFTPSSHTHSLSEVTDAGDLAALNTNASTTNFLRGDGTWATPPNTNTTYSEITTAEIDAGTASTLRTISGRRMKHALDKKADASHTHAWAEVTDKPIVQTTGTSTTDIMSQKSVTEALSDKADAASLGTAATKDVGISSGNVITNTAEGTGNMSYSGTLQNNTTGFSNTASGIYTLLNNTTGSYNTAYGANALRDNTSGGGNTATGNDALRKNTTGSSNTASGMQALSNNTTGSFNTASGASTLSKNTTGDLNTACGDKALSKNSTGNNNTAVGARALQENTTGIRNTASGAYALQENTEGSHNTASGYEALKVNTTGYHNTANGAFALNSNTTGNQNTANGSSALYRNTTGNGNTANGANALNKNTEGSNNTANGYLALGDNTTGNSNTANGYAALNANTTGKENTANGANALYKNTTGNYNTANGYQALYLNTTGSHNTANGANALQNNSTGINNTANGANALNKNTEGVNNTASGAEALLYNTTGSRNTANGYQALQLNTVGTNNTASGYQALRDNTGYNNTAFGAATLSKNTTGSDNVAIGFQVLLDNTTGSFNTASGLNTLRRNTTGDGNTAYGANALRDNTSGGNNTAIGANALSANVSWANCTGLGYNAQVTGNNQIQLGNGSTTAYTNGAVQSRSDVRDKAEVRDTVLGLDFINALRPVDYKFDMRDDYRPELSENPTEEELEAQRLGNITADGTHTRKRYHHGLIAQEVAAVIETMGIDFGGYQDHKINGGDDVLSIGYTELIAPLIKAVQEQQSMIEALAARLDALEGK